MTNLNFAVVTPMANEAGDFVPFTKALRQTLDKLQNGTVYLIVDHASTDNTLELCQRLSSDDERFATVWAPENRNVVDAYLRGYRTAYGAKHEAIIEMDAGLSHDPAQLPDFLNKLEDGYECVFGSRNMPGGSNAESPFKRRMLSKTGTVLANRMLGTRMQDMTSGYQGFQRDIVGRLLGYPLKSRAHFYQTEMRFLMRACKWIEIPIQYRAPSPRVSRKAIRNSLQCLLYYAFRRLRGKHDRI